MARYCRKAGNKEQAVDPKLVGKRNGPSGQSFNPRTMLGLVGKYFFLLFILYWHMAN